jgi:hypothetical protein
MPATERSDGARDAVGPREAVGAAERPTPEERRALFRVVRGTPDDAELAALVVVLAAAAAPPVDPRPLARSTWNDPVAGLRRPLPVGPDAWRTSAWPR